MPVVVPSVITWRRRWRRLIVLRSIIICYRWGINLHRRRTITHYRPATVIPLMITLIVAVVVTPVADIPALRAGG
jgi:hypothetical protein